MVIVDGQHLPRPLFRETSLTFPPANPAYYIFARPALNLTNTLPSPEGNSLEQQRHRYMLSFIQDYPEAWQAWKNGGLLKPEANAQNIIEHSVVAALIGRLIAQEMGLSQMTCHDVALALMVHDADRLIEKKKLLDAAEKPKWANQRRTVAPILTGEHNLLRGIVQDHIIPLASANVPDRLSVHPDTSYQIVHYVDAILDGSVPKTPRDRMTAGANTSGGRDPRVAQLRYKTHEEALGLSQGGYVQLQIDLANQEADRFAEAINQRHGLNLSGNKLPQYLQTLFDQEVTQFAA